MPISFSINLTDLTKILEPSGYILADVEHGCIAYPSPDICFSPTPNGLMTPIRNQYVSYHS